MVEVLLYSKPGCCLCDEVKATIERVRKQHPFELQEVNILDDRELFEEFKEQIPVVFINGRKAFKFHLDEKEFLERLARAERA